MGTIVKGLVVQMTTGIEIGIPIYTKHSTDKFPTRLI